MSDLEFDDDKYFNGYPIEELNNIKDEERNIMLAERELDIHFCRSNLGATVFQQKGYDRGTKQWAARLMAEAEENNNEERDTNDEDKERGTDDEDKESGYNDEKSLTGLVSTATIS